VYAIVRALFRDKLWTWALSPLTLLVPAFTLNHWLNERRFCRKWTRAIEGVEKCPRKLWEVDCVFKANWAS
jgi:hypothetical protein